MEIHEVYSVSATQDDCLLIDMDYTGLERRARTIVAYRASDPYSPLTPIITQWLADIPHETLPYATPAPPTLEELRDLMPYMSMVELRLVLRAIRTPSIPSGIYSADINAMIDVIADPDLQEEARDYFNLGQYAKRTNPWVDILGAGFGLTPEHIDELWAS